MNNILSIDIDWVQDFTQMRNIVSNISKKLNNKEFSSIQVGSTHDEIIETLGKESDPWYVVNVDDHHDLQYTETCRVSTGYRSCNWLGNEMCNKRVAGCTWIANMNSRAYHVDDTQIESEWEREGIGNDIDMLLDFHHDLSRIDDFEYEYLFLCQSPTYIQNNWAAHGAWLSIMSIIDTLVCQNILKKEGNFYYYRNK